MSAVAERAGTEPAFYRRDLVKPDGRGLWLYGRTPIDRDIVATSPVGDGSASKSPPNPHLRWHPLRGEWVAYAGYRQARTFLPPAHYNPLAPTTDSMNPTEVPSGRYDVAVFENLFPTFYRGAHDPPGSIVATRPARGACEVVVFTQDPHTSLGALPLDRVELVIQVWADRTRELGTRSDIEYVFPFENRGVEVGVTLNHPHGQIYAYPFVPPLLVREHALELAHWDAHRRGLLEDVLRDEIEDGRRIVYLGPEAVAFVPAFARYAYEIWVAPRRPVSTLPALSPTEIRDFALALKTVLMKLDALWNKPMPYILAVHQAAAGNEPHPESHVHIEILPAYRMPGRLKYLAGSEIGAGAFTADTFPEEKAAELRAVSVPV